MKGLILKEMYMSAKYFKSFIFIVAVFLGISFFGDNNLMFIAYPCLLTSIMPITLIAYDERCKWDIFSQTLPYTKSQLVSSKYLAGLIFSTVAYILSIAVLTLKMFTNQNFNMDEIIFYAIIMLIVALFCPALILPFVFKFGTEKGRIVFYIICGIFAALMAIFTKNLYGDSSVSISTASITPLLAALTIIVILYAGSWILSIHLYKKRKF